MLFSRLILRPLFAQRLRTLVTLFGVALGVAVMLGIQLANSASLRSFSTALDAVSGRASLEIVGPPAGLDEKMLPGVSWLRQWGVATPVIEAEVLAETEHGAEMLKIIGIDALRDPALRDYALLGQGGTAVAGMQLMTVLSVPDTVILAGGFAKKHRLTQGSNLKIVIGDQTRECRVAAVIGEGGSPSSSLAAQPLAVMDIAGAQDLLGRFGMVDRLELRLHDGMPLEVAEQGLREKLPAGWTVQRPQRRTEAVEKMLAAFHFNLTMLSGIALVVGLFLIYNTVSVSVMTRRVEIGMMRTLGVTRGQVLRLFLGEALVLSLMGASVGVPLAKALAAASVALTSTTVETLYVAQSATVPELTVLHWAAGFVIALPLALLAAAKPALEATRVTPMEAMAEMGSGSVGSEASDRISWVKRLAPLAVLALGGWCATQPTLFGLPLWGYASALCAILAATLAVPGTLLWSAARLRPLLGRLGIEGRLAASQVSASHRRLSISVAALAVSLALTIAIAVMVGSFRETVISWVDQTLGADLYVRPAVQSRSPAPPALSLASLEALRGHPQVLIAEGHRTLDVPFRYRLIRLGAADFDIMAEHGRMVFKTAGEPAAILRAAKRDGDVLASESFALRFEVREGSRINLNTLTGPKEFRIAAIFYDYSNDRGTLSIDQDLFAKSFGENAPTHMALYLKPGADAERVRDEILRSLEGKARLMMFTNKGLRAEVLKIFDSTFAITWALEIIAVLVAMAGVAATMLTLVLERQREMRLLRIAGADAAQVRRTIMIESGLLGLVGQGLGIGVGMLLSLVLIHVINPQSFGWSMQLHVPWLFLVGSTVMTLVGTMLAGLYPAWRITRQRLQT